jgi:kynurenine formamidase
MSTQGERRLRGLAWLVLMAAASALLTAQAAPRPRVTAVQVDQWMAQLSNWGRWGTQDQLGSVNLITPAKKKAAAALVTEGYSVTLSRPLNQVASVDNPSPFADRMVLDPADHQFNMDQFALPVHGFAFTHMDALSHVYYKGKMYNGVPESSLTARGAAQLSVDVYRNGILSRGVIVDIPRLKGLPYLEPGTAIYPDDLDAWEKKTGVTIASGDVVFVRTGRWAYRSQKGAWDIGTRAAGLNASVAEWFKRRDIAVFGSDGAGDVIPSGIDGVTFPLHSLFLVAMGTPMLDQCDLEEVATAAAARNRWTFLVTAAPLRASGGTGSPVNITATF